MEAFRLETKLVGMKRHNTAGFFLLFGCLLCILISGSRAEAQKTTPAGIGHSPFLAVDPPLNIAMLIPGKTRFWKMMADYALAAAEDLGMRLRVIATGNNPGLFLRRLEDACLQGVDGVIFEPPASRGEDALRIAERNGVPCFLINKNISGIHFYPRTKYDQWLGGMTANNEEAGALLLRMLVHAAQDDGFTNLNILAIGGDPAVKFLQDRLKGFENALMRRGAVRKFDKVDAGPDPQQAAGLFWKRFQKDPEINLVWCATDTLALAVAERAAKKAPWARLAIGGIDWDRGALQAVRDENLQSSVGGQVFTGAWAVIMLYDYLKGVDFAAEGVSFATPLFAADKGNVKIFNYLLGISPDSIDFRRFSKTFTPERQFYDFDLLELAAPPQSTADSQ